MIYFYQAIPPAYIRQIKDISMNEMISEIIIPIILAVITGIFTVVASLYQGVGTEADRKSTRLNSSH